MKFMEKDIIMSIKKLNLAILALSSSAVFAYSFIPSNIGGA